jgi:serine/alanine adding enzyme
MVLFFIHRKCMRLYQKTKYYKPIILAVGDDNNKILGLLLAVIKKEYSGVLGFFTSRSIIYGGPLIHLNDYSLLDNLMSVYVKLVKNKVIYTQVRNYYSQDDHHKNILLKHGFKFEEHLNIVLDLTIGECRLWEGLKRSRRKGVNKAKTHGFTFKVVDHLENIEIFYKLLKEVYGRVKLPFPDIRFFKNINDEFNEHKIWFILEYNDEPIIILCAFQYNYVVYAYYIGECQDNNILKLRPTDYFFWEVIRWCSTNGIKYFDWMGAGKPDKDYGVRDFKFQYGGKLVNYGRYQHIHNKFIYSIASNGLKLWKKI